MEGPSSFYFRTLLWAAAAAGINIVLLAVPLTWLYAVAIEGRHFDRLYQAYTLDSLYWCALFTGIPTLFITGYLGARRRRGGEIESAWIIAIPYIVVENYFLIVLTGGTTGRLADFFWAILYILVRFATSLAGGVLAKRRA